MNRFVNNHPSNNSLESLQELGIGVNENGDKMRRSKEKKGLRRSEQVDWEGRQDWLPVARPRN